MQADALDVSRPTRSRYGLSLAVIGASLQTRAKAAFLKGISLMGMGLWVFGSTAWQVLVLGVPRAEIMGVIGALALAANLASVVLLLRYKNGDANVRSVWLCSRNDAIGNVVVMGAAVGVWSTASAWPDLRRRRADGRAFPELGVPDPPPGPRGIPLGERPRGSGPPGTRRLFGRGPPRVNGAGRKVIGSAAADFARWCCCAQSFYRRSCPAGPAHIP